MKTKARTIYQAGYCYMNSWAIVATGNTLEEARKNLEVKIGARDGEYFKNNHYVETSYEENCHE